MKEELTPTIETIIVSPGHNYVGRYGQEPLSHTGESRERVRLLAGRGIEGDRYSLRDAGHPKQITFFDTAALSLLEEFTGAPVPAEAVRRNVFTRGIDLEALIDRTFSLQGIRFRGIESCRPCFWMDEAVGPGAEAMLESRGGLRAAILDDGTLTVGSAVPKLEKE